MRTSTKRILSILISALLVIGALAVYLNLVQDEVKVIDEKRAEVFSKSNIFTNQKQIVDQVKSLISQFQNAARTQETINLAMPVGVQAIQALRQIEAVTKANNVILSALDFKTAAPRSVSKAPSFAKKLGVLEVKLRVDGQYENIRGFLGYLETSVRLANVQDFKFQTSGGKGTDTLVLTVDMYYQ